MHLGKGFRSDDWAVDFRDVYQSALEKFHAGVRVPERLFNENEQSFLQSIGCTAQELYDFVEDLDKYGEPSFETTLLITSVRRDYFLYVQKAEPTGQLISMDGLPPKEAELGGFAWLPRIIEKARAKLRGEMPADLMYGCAGDRRFLKSVNIHPADFLREVWAADRDQERVLRFVIRCVEWSSLPAESHA